LLLTIWFFCPIFRFLYHRIVCCET